MNCKSMLILNCMDTSRSAKGIGMEQHTHTLEWLDMDVAVAGEGVLPHFTGVTIVFGWQRYTFTEYEIPSLSWYHPSRYAPGYLNGTLHDECCELRHHKVHTFEAGLFEFEDLLFYYRLESQVRGEEPCSERSRGHIAFGFGDRERGIGRH